MLAYAGTTGARAEVLSHKEMVKAAIDEHILPQLADFEDKAERLPKAVAAHCLQGAGEPAEPLRQAFADTVISWAGVATDMIGPAPKRDRATRIAFLPDPRGIVRRQMRRVLAQQDTKLLSAAAIAEHSVAIQGLPALEILLFPGRAKLTDEQKRFRCRLAEAIAKNIATQATGLMKGWQAPDGWRAKLLSPGPDNLLYKTETEAASEIVKAYLAAVKLIRESQIIVWHDAVEADKKWAGLPFERAGLSKPYVFAGIASLRQLHEALRLNEIAAALGAKESGNKWIEDWFRNAFNAMERDLKLIALPKDMASAGNTKTAPLRRLKFSLNGINQIIGRRIAPAAGLFIGFNELDGD